MAPGSDGDDEELVEIELEEDLPPPPPPERARGIPAPPVLAETTADDDLVADIVEEVQPMAEAGEEDARADRQLYESEAAATAEPARRSVLLLEAARLVDGGPAEVLEAARRAFAADPALPVTLWPLRRLLADGGHWQELADAYAAAADACAPAAASNSAVREYLADLRVERGRVLEDRLDRDADAIASYRQALHAVPDHVGALLALLLAGARRQEAAVIAPALAGLARRAGGAQHAALAIEEARAWRPTGADGAGRALAVLEAELAASGEGPPSPTVLVELESLTAADVPTDVAMRALAELARRSAPIDVGFAVALWRERARLALRRGEEPGVALESLDEAARLEPTHPIVALERLQLAAALGRGDIVDTMAAEMLDVAADDDQAVDVALLHAELASRGGRDAAVRATLEHPRVRARRGERGDLRALELALAVRRRDAEALHDALVDEAGRATGRVGADVAAAAAALVGAGAIRQWRLDDTAGAEQLYRRALERSPTHAPALHALVALLESDGRGLEAAGLLELALTRAAAITTMFEVWAREKLVSIYADENGEPGKAGEHQLRLVELAPKDVGRRVRLADIDLSRDGDGDSAHAADNLLALADLADDPAVAIALRVEAGRALLGGASEAQRARGAGMLRELVPIDASGLAASGLERTLTSSQARGALVAEEVAAAEADAPAEAVRALRFRLAHHHASDGRYAEALAALTPLRSDGDPLARAWSYELARRSGEAILEVAILSEETRTSDDVLGDHAFVCLAHGEALARAGDPHGAASAFRRALAVAPTGPTAVDAALALLRIAATDPAADPPALSEAMQGLATACADDERLAANAAREAALVRAAVGTVDAGDAATRAPADAPARVRADMAIVNWLAGARIGDPGAVADAFVEMAQLGRDSSATGDAPWLAAVLARAAARARLAGLDAAEPVARRVWEMERAPAMAPALSDLPAPADGAWPAERPDPRRARARRVGGQLGIALDLEVALDAERRGQLATALSLYGAVIGVDPERLEAWTGIRRVARAGGDVVGEARAVARMAAVVRDPEEAASLLAEAAAAYERAGRVDDAVTALAKCIELRPADSTAYLRAHGLLRRDLDVPGRAELFDALLSHRLAAAPLTASARVALLFERGQHRLLRLANRDGAFADFKEILTIQPEHREALHQLARGALEDRDAESAAHWLVQFLAAAADDPRAPEARLELAASYEALKERARAVDTLRRAAASRPGDPKPLQRLSDLQLRLGEWRSAIETLQASEARLPDAPARATLHLRIGSILRDLGRDAPNAAQSFRRAAELDPFSDGTGALVSLYDAAGDARGALDTVMRELADIRRALAADPLDRRRATRLADYLAMARSRGASAPIAEAEAAVASVLQLVGNQLRPPGVEPWNRMRPFAPTAARAFWAELAHPAAGGFAGELWPHLVEAALLLFPPASPRGRRATAAGAADPRFAWIETSATALGVIGLHLYLGREPGPPVVAVEDPAPGLVLAPDVEAVPMVRFHVGRALGVLVQRATVLERVSADDVAPLFACAAIVAGVSPPAGLPAPSEELLRTVMRGIGRKEKKALVLQASRFAFESFDLEAWHEGVLRTADRLGLMMAGDVALSAQALAGGEAAAAGDQPPLPAASVATSPAALDLVSYALSEQYAALRRSVDDAASARGAGKGPR